MVSHFVPGMWPWVTLVFFRFKERKPQNFSKVRCVCLSSVLSWTHCRQSHSPCPPTPIPPAETAPSRLSVASMLLCPVSRSRSSSYLLFQQQWHTWWLLSLALRRLQLFRFSSHLSGLPVLSLVSSSLCLLSTSCSSRRRHSHMYELLISQHTSLTFPFSITVAPFSACLGQKPWNCLWFFSFLLQNQCFRKSFWFYHQDLSGIWSYLIPSTAVTPSPLIWIIPAAS